MERYMLYIINRISNTARLLMNIYREIWAIVYAHVHHRQWHHEEGQSVCALPKASSEP